ncbi:hypothetical protein GCM10007386_28550 [Pseudoduganella dura]|nr:hypothetical protein GCM10007386_28550 [Pseudoduganella dura]
MSRFLLACHCPASCFDDAARVIDGIEACIRISLQHAVEVRQGAERPYSCTLTALWDADSEVPGVWRLADGTTLTLNAALSVHKADDAGGEVEAA